MVRQPDLSGQIDNANTYLGEHVSFLSVQKKGQASRITASDWQELLSAGYVMEVSSNLYEQLKIALQQLRETAWSTH